jgi:hypothetical protein
MWPGTGEGRLAVISRLSESAPAKADVTPARRVSSPYSQRLPIPVFMM